jgi:hypothetical protein
LGGSRGDVLDYLVQAQPSPQFVADVLTAAGEYGDDTAIQVAAIAAEGLQKRLRRVQLVCVVSVYCRGLVEARKSG